MPCLKMTFEAIWGIFCIPLEVKVQISHGIHWETPVINCWCPCTHQLSLSVLKFQGMCENFKHRYTLSTQNLSLNKYYLRRIISKIALNILCLVRNVEKRTFQEMRLVLLCWKCGILWVTYICLEHKNGQCFLHAQIGKLEGEKSSPLDPQGTLLSSDGTKKNWNLVVLITSSLLLFC